jgi:hypothetical protein
MKTVDVFQWIDGIEDLLCFNLPRKRELHEDAVYARVGVQAFHDAEQFLAGRFGCEPDQRALEAGLFTRELFVSHVHGAGGVFSHEDSRQARDDSGRGLELARVARNLATELFGDLSAIDDSCGHIAP